MALLRSLAIVLAVTFLIPVASAQVADPDSSLSVSVTPATAVTIPLGSSAVYNVTVSLGTKNVICQNPTDYTVNLAASGAGLAGVTGDIPATVTVSAPGSFPPASGSEIKQSGTATATFTVKVAATAMGNHDHAFTINATYAGGTAPGGCQVLSTKTIPAAAATATVALKTGPSPTPVSTGTGNMTGSHTGTSSTTKKSFFLPLQFEVGTLLAIGLVGRRLNL